MLSTGYQRLSAVYSWTDLRTGQHDTIAILDDLASFRPPQGVGYMGAAFPYMVVPSAHVGPTGFLITSGEGPEIREYDLTGKLRRLIRLDDPAQPVTRADYDRLASRMAGEVERMKQAYAHAPVPSRRPAFQRLIVDDDGWLWVKTYRTPLDAGPDLWLVFDLDRRCVRAVDMPAELDVQHIGRDFILAEWRDADRVEYVRMHRLDRRD